MKKMISVPLCIDNIDLNAEFSEEAINEIFKPLLYDLSERQRKLGRRMVVFLGASPGAGKSMLVAYLEKLSLEMSENDDRIVPVKCIGLDGYHYYGEKIDASTVTYNGETVPMRSVKGWAETFDAEKLAANLEELQNKDVVLCPKYDRTIHDPVENAIEVSENIIIVEGMWMAYGLDNWAKVQKYCDYRILLLCEVPVLRARYIERKMRGGWSYEKSEEYFNRSDCRAIERIVNDSMSCDLYLESLRDMDIIKFDPRPDDSTMERFYKG